VLGGEEMSKYAENIKKYRLLKNYTQEQLAKQLFVTKQAVSKWETGRGYPDSQLLPELAKILDISIDDLMGESKPLPKVNQRKIIFTTFIITVVFLTIIVNNLTYSINYYDIAQSVANLEVRTKIDIPHHGEYVSEDFSDWIAYGNDLSITKMSYIVFSKRSEIDTFEQSIEQSALWNVHFEEVLLPLVPTGIQAYLTIGDYYLIYNETLQTYNESPDSSAASNYVLFVYQEDINRLLIFEYTIQYWGEMQ
jgi:transcriptional regulator with XRE-family HTH domain